VNETPIQRVSFTKGRKKEPVARASSPAKAEEKDANDEDDDDDDDDEQAKNKQYEAKQKRSARPTKSSALLRALASPRRSFATACCTASFYPY